MSNLIIFTLLTFAALPLFSQPSPQQSPSDWMLAFLDVETTGLTPGYHEIVNLGIVLSDLEGNEKSRILLYLQPNHPDRATPEAVAINGFDLKLWKSLRAVTPQKAVDSLVSFYKTQTDGKRVLMVAYNSQFDAAFMNHLFREAGRNLSEIHYYFVLDVPSMAWILGLRDLKANEIAKKFKIPATSSVPIEHHGLGCADLNIRLYRELVWLTRERSHSR